jgi:phage terminase small subunit
MGARGRTSTAALAVVAVDDQERPAPWPNLAPAEADYWRNIVDSLPPTWFRPSDLPLLAAYCKAAARHDAAVDRLGGEQDIYENTRTGVQMPNANYRIISQCIAQMAQLAGKLRLCPSARYDEGKAHRQIKHSPPAKAWQWQPGN